jgi:zinc transport system substrate-binding protein
MMNYCNPYGLLKSGIAILGALFLTAAFCGFLHAEDKIQICVSILPQQYFVQQIGRDRVDVQVMVPPGASPETYEPKPAQMTALGKTKIYFSLGVPFETVWLNKIAGMNPGMRIINTDEGIEKRLLEAHSCGGADDRSAVPHHHAAAPLPEHTPDPHIWLSPPLVMMQARMILLGLQQADPAQREFYAQNYRTFIISLIDLDDRLRRSLADIRTTHFMVLHPAWGYFAQAYGLTQVPVEVEGKAPKPAQLKQIIDYARQHALTVIIAQPRSSLRWAEQVAKAINGQIVYADPLSPEWEKNLLEVAETIKTALP